LLGLAGAGSASDTVAAALYTPYHGTLFALAAVVVWAMPNTWQFTERLTIPRAASGFALLLAALLLMWTQTVNPFLYFQF
jgi:alginate O-acetyltransferase complex protein AlgI